MEWIEPLPPGPLFNPRIPTQYVQSVGPAQAALFANLATSCKWYDYELMFEDIEFDDLLVFFKDIVRKKNGTMTDDALKTLIDYNDWKMELYWYAQPSM